MMGILEGKDKIIFQLPCFSFRFGGYTKELWCNFMFNLFYIILKSRRILMMLKALSPLSSVCFHYVVPNIVLQVGDVYEDDILVPSSKDLWNNLSGGLVLF